MKFDSYPANLTLRKLLGFCLWMVHPVYGRCYRCSIPWSNVSAHVTDYSGSSGCFPLCKHCWQSLTPKQRWPFYQELIADWEHEADKARERGVNVDGELSKYKRIRVQLKRTVVKQGL